jgi:O-antigen ligase
MEKAPWYVSNWKQRNSRAKTELVSRRQSTFIRKHPATQTRCTESVLLLLLASAVTRDEKDIETFFWVNLWGLALISAVPLTRAFLDPSGAFEDGRLRVSQNTFAIIAGALLLVALTLYTLRKNAWLIGVVVFGATVMIMSGGKAGIIAGIVSVFAFFVLQKRLAASFGWLLVMIGIVCVVLATTPLASHFRIYQEEGSASNISGRTDLWQAAWPEILRRPILGHGYLASRFVSEYIDGGFQNAGHLHNGFIDTLYNTGLIGLAILVMIHFVIVRDLCWILKRALSRITHILAVGLVKRRGTWRHRAASLTGGS